MVCANCGAASVHGSQRAAHAARKRHWREHLSHAVEVVPVYGMGCDEHCHGWCVLDGEPCHAVGVACAVCGFVKPAFDWEGRSAVLARCES